MITAFKKIAGLESLKNKSVHQYVLNGLALAFFIFYFFKLHSSLGHTFFWSDENFHAYVSIVISEIKGLPAVLPDKIYGGYVYSYPPLFHIIGALFISMAGFPALKFINLILLILFLAGFYLSIRKHYGNHEALLACLLLSLAPIIAINSIRFMAEMLSMTLVFFSFFYLVVAIKRGKNVYAIISGLSTGLLILCKQIGIVVIGFYLMLLIWFLIRRRQNARLLIYLIGTAALIIMSYFIWAIYHGIEMLGFVSMFLGTKPQWAAAAVKSFRRYDSSLREFGYLFYNGNGAVITVSYLIPLYHFIRTRAKDAPQNYIFWLYRKPK